MVSGEAGKWMKGFSSRNPNGWQVADIPENSGQGAIVKAILIEI